MLVTPELFDRLAGRIVKDEDIAEDRAARIMDQALAFLATCATTDFPLSPSDNVDIGWHTFVLHTRDYADFCHQVAGRFIHHVPLDADPTTHGEAARAAIDRTVHAISGAGFVIDAELWQPSAVSCSQCHAGCTDSP